MGNKKSQPTISIEAEPEAADWNGQFVDCDSVDWGVSEPIPERDNVRTLRATVFGTGGAGKSCLLTKWFCDKFSVEYDPTIENYFRKQILVGDTVYTLEVLDTAGQEEFVAMQDSWISDSTFFLLVFSLEDRDSFGYVKHMERKIMRLKDGSPFACVLCGTKKDLAHWSDFDPLLYAPGMEGDQLLQRYLQARPTDLVVSYLWEPRHVHCAEAVAFARERSMFSYVEASSYSGFNVDKVFRVLAHCILINNQRFAMQKKAERRGSRNDLERRGSRSNLERRGSKNNMERRGSKNNLERRGSKNNMERRGSKNNLERRGSKGPLERRGSKGLLDRRVGSPAPGERSVSPGRSREDLSDSRTAHTRSHSTGPR